MPCLAPPSPCPPPALTRPAPLPSHSDNDVDLAVLEPDWEPLLASLAAALPQYTMRIVVPSDDPDTRFIRVYCPLGMADVFGATAAGEGRLLVDWCAGRGH